MPPAAPHAHPTWGEVFDERAPLVGAPAFFGPPVIFVLGPWTLLMLLLIGPFALIVTIVLVVAAAAGLVGVCVAAIASPYLLARHLHARGMVRAERRAALRVLRTRRAAPRLLRKYRVSSRRLGSPQPKGMS